ncbi:SDR family oxidoreductase [Hoeflea prorocentri]|uniref:SDR family oxidoreductase n=1 Tax=Hoeflea prorocentri TaxID=1922333 RepID=A0A9X3ZHX9_9HYPH|nr:SDR family oxidoreductase [Hoeflea prorocentri]MCY6381824.1 SDR family oxidoreductase [Hoeflea prorocentri]MDA5399624.1 SDR family oxidoreductase [Hoeflea prorocentri]
MMKELNNRLSGRTAIVTAAAQGIGRAVAERLHFEGANVHASDLNGAAVADLSVAETVQLDATDPDAVESYFSKFDQIDVLVHAVGYVHQGTIEECTATDWQRSVDITLTSAFNVIGAAVPKMKENGGSIVTIGSVASSIKGFPKRAAYCAAKGGVIGLTKAVAADYIGNGIRCNSVCPGVVDSPSLRGRIDDLAKSMNSREEAYRFFIDRQPAGRFGTAEEIAAICAFLASDEGAFVNGQAINVDGGITI